MKKLLVLATVLVALSSCTSKTEFGDCIGAFDKKDPNLEYKVSAWNVFWGVVGFELILPPIFVVVDQTHCPVGRSGQ